MDPPPSFMPIPRLEELLIKAGIPGLCGAPAVFEMSFFIIKSIRPWPSSSEEFIPDIQILYY
jgi:hypothetical protein